MVQFSISIQLFLHLINIFLHIPEDLVDIAHIPEYVTYLLVTHGAHPQGASQDVGGEAEVMGDRQVDSCLLVIMEDNVGAQGTA